MASELSHLLPPCLPSLVTSWLVEDIPAMDVGGFVVGSKSESANLLAKATGVLAGVPFFDEVFRQVNCSVEWKLGEGDFFEATNKDRLLAAVVTGKASDLLRGERTALNMLARASGIALRARRLADKAKAAGWKGRVAGTRKTTPGFRVVEKYAMLIGGCDTHRFDLSSMCMLKDNHIWSAGSITAAVAKARSAGGFSLKIEVETSNQEDAEEAIEAGADVVMLDNFEPAELHVIAKALKEKYEGKKAFLLEASGGITEESIDAYFGPHIDVLSLGAVTQSVGHVDYSLKIVH